MKIVNFFLLVATVGTALFVVHTQHASRRNFVAIEEGKQALRLAEQDNDRLEVEKRAQTTPLRVELLATTKLNMRHASPSITQYVVNPAAPSASAGGGQ